VCILLFILVVLVLFGWVFWVEAVWVMLIGMCVDGFFFW